MLGEELGGPARAQLSGFLLPGPHPSSWRRGRAGSGRPVACRESPPRPLPLRALGAGAGSAAGPAPGRSIASSCSSYSTHTPLGTKVGGCKPGSSSLAPPSPPLHSYPSPSQHPVQEKGKREARIQTSPNSLCFLSPRGKGHIPKSSEEEMVRRGKKLDKISGR